MRVALVYDYLNQYGGGERVLRTLMEMFPEAPVYTLFHDEEGTWKQFPRERIAGTSWLDRRIVARYHRFFIPFFPRAAESIDLGDKYDLIVTVGAGYAKGVKYGSGYHLDYCFTPIRYAWESKIYLAGKFGAVKGLAARVAGAPILRYLREWDRRMGQKPDKIMAVSRYIAGRVQACYKREASVLYPPVDRNIFYCELPSKYRQYYLAAGRFLHYKRFDLVVAAFNELKLPLKVVGRGPELFKLAAMNTSRATSFITAPMSDEEMRGLYNNAAALIFPQVEDFGLAAAEAIACGTPVVAYRQGGGAAEIVRDGENGILIEEQSPQAITEAVGRIKSKRFDAMKIAETADRFSLVNFKNSLREEIKKISSGI